MAALPRDDERGAMSVRRPHALHGQRPRATDARRRHATAAHRHSATNAHWPRGRSRPQRHWLWRIARGVLLGLAALVFFLEEWGWQPLAAWASRWSAWPPLARLEVRIRRQRPAVALALFFAPMVLLLPLKLFALWLMHEGRVGLGVAFIVAAKLVGTAFVGRLFILVEPQLMHFRWFVRTMRWWRRTKLRVTAALRERMRWQPLRPMLRRGWLALRMQWRRFVG